MSIIKIFVYCPLVQSEIENDIESKTETFWVSKRYFWNSFCLSSSMAFDPRKFPMNIHLKGQEFILIMSVLFTFIKEVYQMTCALWYHHGAWSYDFSMIFSVDYWYLPICQKHMELKMRFPFSKKKLILNLNMILY